ncbi:MAG TPA: NUDIX domain-containing protein [Patescibacteria group bacterium]|nr:NUDIX domain-containing protein [Patescibacteria group bacterium]
MPVVPLPSFVQAASLSAVDVHSVHAVLLAEDGRLLLQRRDDKPGIVLRDHWAFFAGAMEAGEAAEQTLRRELAEELRLGGDIEPVWLTESVCVLPRERNRVAHRVWFVVPLSDARLAALDQREGAGRGLFTIAEMAALPKVAPWDVAAAMLLTRREVLFGDGGCLPLSCPVL